MAPVAHQVAADLRELTGSLGRAARALDGNTNDAHRDLAWRIAGVVAQLDLIALHVDSNGAGGATATYVALLRDVAGQLDRLATAVDWTDHPHGEQLGAAAVTVELLARRLT